MSTKAIDSLAFSTHKREKEKWIKCTDWYPLYCSFNFLPLLAYFFSVVSLFVRSHLHSSRLVPKSKIFEDHISFNLNATCAHIWAACTPIARNRMTSEKRTVIMFEMPFFLFWSSFTCNVPFNYMVERNARCTMNLRCVIRLCWCSTLASHTIKWTMT